VLLHACNFRWAKKITLSHETGIFKPDMKMLKVHQNAPTSMLKSYIFSGVIPRTPVSKREEREGRGWVGLGREGIGVWPTQKLSRGAPYETIGKIMNLICETDIYFLIAGLVGDAVKLECNFGL
jgi:hypothetical protein